MKIVRYWVSFATFVIYINNTYIYDLIFKKEAYLSSTGWELADSASLFSADDVSKLELLDFDDFFIFADWLLEESTTILFSLLGLVEVGLLFEVVVEDEDDRLLEDVIDEVSCPWLLW